ncbi:MAG TPA: alkaline phosphatase family protein [Candidatus Cybelea sp.]|nr:alkaline phosphatase family protein [Candidatus Cybelea sp.]
MARSWINYGSCAIVMVALAACGGIRTSPFVAPVSGSRLTLVTPIKHVVIIVQENRTPDYLFQGVPGADISSYGKTSQGVLVPLHQVSLGEGYDLGHGHESFIKDYDHGKMDGFDIGLRKPDRLRPFGYAVPSEVRPYHFMATYYAFADRMFESNQGPSFPAHLYLISGTADTDTPPWLVENNPLDSITHRASVGGCDAPKSAIVNTIDPGNGFLGPTPFPCFDRSVITDFLDAKGVSWRYYQSSRSAGLWEPFDAIRHVRYGPDYANVIYPETQVLTDIAQGHLAGVTWVVPDGIWSDHAGKHSSKKGPRWVAAIVNAIGESAFWKSTAIFVTWDDWGGWYDHVAPPIDNFYELGFRVPLVILSAYTPKGHVSKKQHEFGSLLAFTEETFGIPKGVLHSTDVRADDLMDSFDFTMLPRPFRDIPSPKFIPAANRYPSEEDP